MTESTPDNSLSSQAAIDQLCIAFKEAWQSGSPPEISKFLTRSESISVSSDSLFRGLLLVDIDYRHRAGTSLTAADYGANFPQFKTVIFSLFAELDDGLDPVELNETVELTWEASSGTTNSAPRSVGRYQLLERVGRGGFGEVWRAHDPE